MSIGWIGGRRAVGAILGLAVLLFGAAAWAQAVPAVPIPATSTTPIPVSAFDLEYALEHPDHPPLAELEALPVSLRFATGGMMPAHPQTENITFPLGAVPQELKLFPGTLRFVLQQILAVFEARGIGGVLILLPDLEDGTGRDLRTPGDTRLRVQIWTGRIERVATVADGDRFAALDEAGRTNHPAHAFIRDTSPVTAGGARGLLRVDDIEDFAFRLSRHPGRRVDALMRPGELPGTTQVDYHVAESKPWMVYAQLANNGTEATDEWRQRFGFSHNQLTGRDDVLKLDYVTSAFDEIHGVWGSYSAPVLDSSRLRWSAVGGWSEYGASEVGLGSLDIDGDQWEAGGRLHWNVLQVRELFVDVVAGARWRHVGVESDFQAVGFAGSEDADADFFLPEVGIELRRDTFVSSAALEVVLDHNLGGFAGTDRDDLRPLGTRGADESFTRVRWNGGLSIYLEPALRRRQFLDPNTIESSRLAHELVLGTRGIVSLDDRLVPQFQQVAGGLTSVRGYEQSIVSGDQVVIGSAEYRIHLPRLLRPGEPTPPMPGVGRFRVRPEHVYGQPDWDFIVKAFVDAANLETIDGDRFDEDDHESLVGLGLGAELHLDRYFQARVEVAWPQRRLDDIDTDGPELHALFTVMY